MLKPERGTRTTMQTAPARSGDAGRRKSRHPWVPAHEPTFQVGNLDAVDWLARLPSESVDLVVTDPAYESLEKHRAIGTTTRLKKSKASSNDWFGIFPNRRFPDLFRELWRVLKRNSHLYVFCDQETAFVVKPIAEAAGFKFWKFIVWDKEVISTGYHYRARHELILFLEKGKRNLNDRSEADIITARAIRGRYPTEKPVSVSEILIRQSSNFGQVVADPFMGSGSVGVAAIQLGRRFLGNDKSRKAVARATRRLRSCMKSREEVVLSRANSKSYIAAPVRAFTRQLVAKVEVVTAQRIQAVIARVFEGPAESDAGPGFRVAGGKASENQL